jgi:N-acetylmuramoyl-L-alanine amidase
MRPRPGRRRIGPTRHPRASALGLGLVAVLVACTGSPSGDPSGTPAASADASTAASGGIGQVVPPPGSASRIYAPNPSAIVVAIDPGHGGCLDWGVPNPYDNTVERSEKAMTLAISLALREWLAAEGVRVVMTRETDVALAGDLYPDLGCHGDPFRDVNGDGVAGFGPDVPEHTRTRDELSAHIDLVNLARADVLISVHINSFTENGVVIEIAGTETFWTDETPWGVPHSERLATAVQASVVAALDVLAPYEREDRGTDAVNYYVLAPPTTTGDRAEPRRGSLMPAVLAEVGSMSLSAEADLLATPEAQEAIAAALGEALVTWFTERGPAARLKLAASGGDDPPEAIPGTGPPYWPPSVEADEAPPVTITNTGRTAWPPGAEVLVGWQETDEPYLARPPALDELDVALPPLEPGASVTLALELPQPPQGVRAVGWLTIGLGDDVLSETGSPALQFEVNR